MFIYIALILAGLVIDQLTKSLAVWFLSDVTTVPLIPKVFHLTYIENPGIAFSFLSGKQGFIITITAICIAALCYVLYILPKNKKWVIPNIGISLIISGAAGNLVDRISHSYVIDFIDFRIIGFPIFNFADIMVCVGAFMIIITLLQNKKLFEKTPEEKTNPPVKPKSAKKKKPQAAAKPKKPLSSEAQAHVDGIKVRRERPNYNIEPQVRTQVTRLAPHNPKIDFYPTPPNDGKGDRKNTKNLDSLKSIQKQQKNRDR
ncbi:MAG: signal peptidase II [Eubacteriaceae bacterium]